MSLHDPSKTRYLTKDLTAIAAGGSHFLPLPRNGRVVGISGTVEGVLPTGDAAITFEIGGTTIKDSAAVAVTFSFGASDSVGDRKNIRNIDQDNRFSGDAATLEIITTVITGTMDLTLTIEVALDENWQG